MAFSRLMIVDDHALIRDALQALLSSHQIAGSLAGFSSLQAAIDAANSARPPFDLALLDLGFPGIPEHSIAALEEFRLRLPTLPVVVISASDDRDIVLRCLDAGAMGYVPKNAETTAILAALRVVAAGGVYVPPHVMQRACEPSAGQLAFDELARRARSGLDALTPRQREVLRLMIKGLPNKLIARELRLSDNTVKAHVSAVLREFAARNRTEAVLIASRIRLSVSDHPGLIASNWMGINP